MNLGGNEMKKMYGLISRVLLVIMVVMQVTSLNGMNRVSAANYSNRLSYVIVNGGYFDTGIKINQDYSIEMVFSVSDVSQYKNYYESMANNQRAFRLRQEVGKGLYAAYGWYNGNVYTMKANEELIVAQKRNITYINNAQVQKATMQEFQATTNLKFGDFKGYIKSFRIWNESNTLVANYVPVLDGNGKVCMYDTVKGKFVYYTGQCKAGSVVEQPKEDSSTEIQEEENEKVIEDSSTSDILESTGSSLNSNISYVDALAVKGGRFDSGLKVNLNYSLEAVFALSSLSQYKNVYEATYNNSRVFRLRNESSSGLRIAYGWYEGKKLYYPAVNEEITVLQKKNITYINGKQVQKATVQTLESDTTLKFGDFSGNLVSFRIWNESNKLVAEFLPVLDGNDKACMYDTVNKKYVYYSGTCTAVVEDDTVTEDIIIEDVIVNLPVYGSSSSVNGSTSDSTSGTTDSTTTFRDELKEMILTGDMTTHNIAKYGLTYSQVDDTWEDLKAKECYIALKSYGAAFLSTTKSSDGIVQTIYIYNSDEDFVKRYNRTCAAIKSFLSVVDNKMSNLDKIVYAHEYVVKNTTYRNSNLIDGSAGGVLGDGYGKCSGYAEAMIVLLHEMDINSYYISSTSMNHGWLMVELDGQYYHIDPTWDNTQPGTNDVYYHRFLLRNDTEFETIKASRTHYNWYCSSKTGITSTSTRFTNWFVHDVAGCMYYYDGLWYYRDIDSNSIYCSDINGNSKTLVIDGNSKSETVKLNGITSGVLKYSVGGTTYTKSL